MMVMNATTFADNLLLEKLLQKQTAEKLSDYGFTAKLGIDRTTWTHIRRGRRNIGLTLLKAIAQTYPDLDQDILNFLRDSIGET